MRIRLVKMVQNCSTHSAKGPANWSRPFFLFVTKPLSDMQNYEVDLPPAVAKESIKDQETLKEMVRRRLQVELNKLKKYQKLGVWSVEEPQLAEVALWESVLFLLENPERMKQKAQFQVVRKILKFHKPKKAA